MSTAEMNATRNSARILIDARLDAIDRALLGRVSRAERLDVVGEVESRIDELLQGRVGSGREASRDDVLAVLSRLDPPEAYLGDEAVEPHRDPFAGRPTSAPRVVAAERDGTSPIARASAILGGAALASFAFLPIGYGVAVGLGSETFLFAVWGLVGLFMLLGGTVAVVLASFGGVERPASLVGLICGILAVVLVLASAGCLVLMI
ncbi:hypothetical protein [Paludisphaera soli]|uniref:hypothetical protein n=1 Tax=Paludisphaera soli TaxID=2712865 RepID=UPI0013ECE7B5|nr:hypothetical protein [Paludisphaera soli]